MRGGFTPTIFSSAELYDPEQGTSVATGDMTIPRIYHSATLLSDGRVLIAGGGTETSTCSGCPTATAEIYDPVAGIFSTVGSMMDARAQHFASVLDSGLVLVGGGSPSEDPTAELYDPTTQMFMLASSMHALHQQPAVQLQQKILLSGGDDLTATKYTDIAELYDPSSGQFVETGKMATPRIEQTVTPLD